jgi:hypothetical protein
MLRKILWISLVLTLFPSLSRPQTHLALRGGMGILRYSELIDVDRYRFLVALDAANALSRGRDISLDLRGEAEFSYSMYDYKDMKDVSAWGVSALFDIFPEIALNLQSRVQPCLGAGLTFGLESTRHTVKGIRLYDHRGVLVRTYDSKDTYRDHIYGLTVRPSLKLLAEQAFFRGAVKYRYFLDRVRYKWEWNNEGNVSEKEDYLGQSIDIAFSVGFNLGSYGLEGGLQAENWVLKHEDSKEWPKWPDDWEYMLFGKIHFSP